MRVQLKIQGILIVAAFLLLLVPDLAQARPSQIDDKYRQVDPVLYGKYDEARSLLDRYAGESEFLELGHKRLSYVLKKNDRFAPAYMQLGRLFMMIDESGTYFELAEQATLKAIEIEPEYADAYVLLGHVYTNTRRHDKAVEALLKAERIGTSSPWLYINLADEYLDTGKFDDALRTLEKASAVDTDSLKAQRAIPGMYIRYYVSVNDFANADIWFQKSVKVDPTNAWTYGNYAEKLVWYAGNFPEGEKRAREAISLMDYGRARYILAAALFAQWVSLPPEKRSSKTFNEAISLYPDIGSMADDFEEHPSTKPLAEDLRKAAASRSDAI